MHELVTLRIRWPSFLSLAFSNLDTVIVIKQCIGDADDAAGCGGGWARFERLVDEQQEVEVNEVPTALGLKVAEHTVRLHNSAIVEQTGAANNVSTGYGVTK